MRNKLKWLTSLDQKVMGAGVGADGRQLLVTALPGLFAGTYGRMTPRAETSKPRILASTSESPIFPPRPLWVQTPGQGQDRSGSFELTEGKPIASDAQEGAGIGSWKKRMPACNRPDRGSSFAPPRSEQTSRRCLSAKKSIGTILNGECNGRRGFGRRLCSLSFDLSKPDGLARVSQSTLDIDLDLMSETGQPRRAGQRELALEMLEPCAVKVARTVLRGVRGRQRPRAYSAGGI